MNDSNVSFEDFKTEWLQEIIENNPTTVQLGNRFSKKIVMQWLDFNEDNDDIVFCDGSCDGGIDIAYLQRGDISEDNTSDGDTWYLVQSKYGSAFAGKDTLLIEAQKVIETIDGKTKRLSSLASDLVERIQNFKASVSSKDKLVLVFATINPISEDEKRVLEDVKALGRARLGDFFDTKAISVETIYQSVIEKLSQYKKYKLPFTANLVSSGNELLVGSVKLNNLYQFLKDYENETGDLNLIYEKNVRKFLGSGKKVNQGIANTLKDNPERFGLYNNGITIVVENFEQAEADKYDLTEPYIVNGCQTTRTIWETLGKRLEKGGTGVNPFEEWESRLKKGIVVVKVVKVGEDGDKLLEDTTRYTNSQNAVGKKDFIALEDGFRIFAKEMASSFDIFLEIQRGGWESQKVLQKTNPYTKIFEKHANAFDLLKIYGAGWLSEPGAAFGKNAPFAPGGSVFKTIFENGSFGINDMYASYLLQSLTTQKVKFGRDTTNQSTRGKTRYLFYYILIELLKDCMIYSKIELNNSNLSDAIISVFESDSEASQQLTEAALNVIDDYMTKGNEDSAFEEPKYDNDMNNFMKWDKLGKGNEFTPKLWNLIVLNKHLMRKSIGGQKSARELICETIG